MNTLKINSPKDIYFSVRSEVEKLLLSLESQNIDEEVRKTQEEALKKLNIWKLEIDLSLSQLDENSEWDIFTIAFYGETNAGKSTLIETLRILFSEPEKVKERQMFSEKCKEYENIQQEIDQKIEQAVALENEYKNKQSSIDGELKALQEYFGGLNVDPESMQKRQEEIDSIKKEIDELKRSIKIGWKTEVSFFFNYVLRRLPSQKKANELQKRLEEKREFIEVVTLKYNKLIQLKGKLADDFEMQKQEYAKEEIQLNRHKETCFEDIKKYEDGQIIGDGRSDYTRNVTNYSFKVNEQSFAFLDLPGIEGNEKLVLDNINIAVQKAHAVFYVTSKPTPPQKGDEKTNVEGTIEKIKKHLGQQTEVFTIFNKRITSPHALNEQLISENETNSIEVLDETMRGHLGEQYQRCIPLSAYPAFLSLANCWQSNLEKHKKKFMECFEPSQLRDKTNITSFASWLTNDIVTNCMIKIKKSNFNKVAAVLNNITNEIKQIHQNYISLQKDLTANKKNTDTQLDDTILILKNRLDTACHTEINNFKNKVRNKIYADIDGKINNDEFKNTLEIRTKSGIEELQSNLEGRIKNIIEDIEKEISNIVNKYQKYAEDLLNAYNTVNKFGNKFELNVDIKSGIDWLTLGTTLVSTIILAIALISNPAGWVAMVVLSVIGLCVNVYKILRSFLSSEYRKSQQKKTADENIDKIGQGILKSVADDIRKAHSTSQSSAEDIKVELAKIINRVKMTIDILNNAERELFKLADIVKKFYITGK